MRIRILQVLSATIVAATSLACGTQPGEPITPPLPEPQNPPQPGTPVPPPPPVDTAAIIGEFRRVSPSVTGDTAHVYVLRSDSTFLLRGSYKDLRGRYYRLGHFRNPDQLEFSFQEGEDWYALASLRGDSLVVHYNPSMLEWGFENGIHLRQ
jgi:hypothetical protein